MISRQTLSWVGAGLAFAVYPATRPWTDETTMSGLAAMASDRWIVAHLAGMLGFVLLAVGVVSLAGSARLAAAAVVLLLPYYGSEAFGLHAVGRYAVATGDLGQLVVVDGSRYQPIAVLTFGAGLALLAVVGVRLALRTWLAGGALRLAGLAVGAGLVLYLPQFYAVPGLRIAHGVLLGLGCVAVGLLTQRITPSALPATPGKTAEVLASGNRDRTTSPSTTR